jgi:small subunit ribosomal protein S9
MMEKINAIGRRKTAIARIYVTEGKGQILINKRDVNEYFKTQPLIHCVTKPLGLLNAIEKYDIKGNVCGGGITGQAEAVRLAIARALVKINAEDKSLLRANGLLTRDPRKVERKKPGQPGARKRFQFSKR